MAVRRTEGTPKRLKERREAGPARSASEVSTDAKPAQQVWRGASGAAYAHTISSLLYCPEMPEGTYVLLHRDAAGATRVLRVGTLDSKARSLNLARVRQAGATLGANEVHFRIERSSGAERARIAFDIEHALDGAGALVETTPCGVHQPA